MAAIEVNGLTKTFRTYKKQPGFAGAVKGLWRRQYEQTVAVKDVTFQVEPGELVGFLGLLTLLGIPVYLAYRGIVGTFEWSLLWLLAVPLVLGIVGRVMVEFSWWMASRKNFHYDYERRESTWIEAGEKRSYTYSDWEAANRLTSR